jgi:hypothetical protein
MSAPALPEVPLLLERPPVDWERHRGNGSPKILPPPGETWRNDRGRKVGHRYYTRTTTYADALSEQYNLTAWKLRRLALGMGRRSDYVRLAAALTDADRDRAALDELVVKALEAAGPNAADLGTALHSLTERVDYGEPLGEIPDEIVPDLTAYEVLTDGVLRHRWREVRTVCDRLECAGTPDTIAHVLTEPCPAGCGPETLHVGDTKTGSIRYPGKMSTQLAIYSRSARYDPETGERTPLDVCPSWGFIVHVPVETGRAALFWLDLDHGWAGAELCGPVREWRKAKADDILRPFATVAPVEVREGGEVVRVEPRLASTNLKAPAPPTELAEPTEFTLEPARGPHEAPEPVDDGEVESEDAADLDGTDDVSVAEVVQHPSGHVEVVGEPIVVGTMWLEGMNAERCPVLESETNPAAPRCEGVAGHPGGHRFPADVTPVERCVHELRLGECAMPSCRPDLAHLTDEGVERDQFVEIPAEVFDETTATGQPVKWPGVDDLEIEQLASGPDSSAEPEPVVADPVREAIVRCVTVRDLELLSSREWRSWGPGHRELATEVHERLEAAERAARPRAAFEAAVRTASTRAQLAEIAETVDGEPWYRECVPLLDQRWRELAGS